MKLRLIRLLTTSVLDRHPYTLLLDTTLLFMISETIEIEVV